LPQTGAVTGATELPSPLPWASTPESVELAQLRRWVLVRRGASKTCPDGNRRRHDDKRPTANRQILHQREGTVDDAAQRVVHELRHRGGNRRTAYQIGAHRRLGNAHHREHDALHRVGRGERGEGALRRPREAERKAAPQIGRALAAVGVTRADEVLHSVHQEPEHWFHPE